MHSHAAHAGMPTEVLMEEHRVIERVLKILDVLCEKLQDGEEVSPEIFENVLDFIRTFADRCHHGKEEKTLFPCIEKKGIPRAGGPTGMMLMET